MGLFCVNIHFRTADAESLSQALNRRGITRYQVVAANDGWTSLYEERASEQDDQRIRELAAGLSADLHAAAIAFMVHDSDIACYWLFDDGRLLDEYNSCPDYFDAAAVEPAGPSGGSPDVLLPYCRTGVKQEELAAILTQKTLFAESVIEQLAEALGIDPERALTDYRDAAGGDGPGGFDGGDDDDDGDQGGPSVGPSQTGLVSRMARMLGMAPQAAVADPQLTALVEAAANDDTDAIDRLLAAGVAIEAEAPVALPGREPMAELGKFLPGGMPKMPMTPLLAAVLHKRRHAAARLLDGGADPNRVHPILGTPLHAATAAGDDALLRLLLDRGGDVGARNVHGQTPLQLVAASRATVERLAQAQTMIKSMDVQIPGLVDQLSKLTLPTAGWDACEQLLKARGAA